MLFELIKLGISLAKILVESIFLMFSSHVMFSVSLLLKKVVIEITNEQNEKAKAMMVVIEEKLRIIKSSPLKIPNQIIRDGGR